jgi:hypothetical protein
MYRKPHGPPSAVDQNIDQWLHRSSQAFDLSPLMNGDQVQATALAQHYIEHLKAEAGRASLNWQAVVERLRQISPHFRRGLMTFSTILDARLRT